MFKQIVTNYFINQLGEIKNIKTDRILKQKITQRGYMFVTVSINGKLKDLSIHREVAKAFISNDNNLSFVNHKDGNKQNNSVENLEWCTPSENMKHAYKNNLIKDGCKGETCHLSKLKDEDVINIRFQNLNGVEINKIAKEFNVSCKNIKFIINRKTWKHI